MSNRNSFIESTKETDERLEALKQLYPEIFSDGKINLDAFKDVTGTSDLLEGQDRTPGYYGLYWPGKRAAKQLARKEAEGTLEPVPGDGVNEDTTHNIYIEGDNLEVLRILKQSYKGRVKMIYIDPPYNTGNDFIYPDDFKMPVEEYLKITGQADEGGRKLVTNLKSNGAFHTTWLNMMYPRLQLARELLTEDGVIFISIDDNEQANLKLLCDDVFGEENNQATVTYVRKTSGKQDSSNFMKSTEYILVYSKSSNWDCRPLVAEDNVTDRYNKVDEEGNKYRETDLRKTGTGDRRIDRPAMWYPFYYNPKTEELIVKKEEDITLEKKGYKKIVPIKSDGTEGRWRWGFSTAEQNIEFLVARIMPKYKDEEKYTVYEKDFIDKKGEIRTIKEHTSWDRKEFNSDNAMQEFKNLNFSNQLFPFPKSSDLIKHMIYLSNCGENDIIMDFFSGSATTAQALIKLNNEEKSNRRFVLVQLPEKTKTDSEAYISGYKNICEIGKERIRRAGAKILEESKANKDMFSEDNPLDVGFKVYRLQNSNFVKYTPVEGQNEDSQNKLFEEFEKNQIPLVQGWKAENVLTEIILKQGFALDCTKEKVDSFKKNTIWKITDSADTVSKKIKLYVCLDNSIEEETIKNLTLNDDEKFICLDAAIDDSAYARLADKGRIETI